MTLTLADFSWVAAVLTFTGVILAGRKNILCWPIWLTSNVFWLVSMTVAHQWSVVTLNVTYVALNILGWRKWAKDRKPASLGGQRAERFLQRQQQQSEYEDAIRNAAANPVTNADLLATGQFPMPDDLD